MEFWRETRKRAVRTEESKNARGIWVIETQTLGAHCNVHEIAGWIGMLGGAQRRRRRAKNLQVFSVIKNRSSIRVPTHTD
jgi:hypothetical protein